MRKEDPSIQEAPTTPDVEAELRAQLEASRREAEELLSRLKYLQADYENFRKRSAREMESTVKFAHEALLNGLLPVLDEFNAAVQNVEGPTGEGLRMVRDNLWKALQEVGLKEIPAEPGSPFDPYLHEAIGQVPAGDLPEGSIKEVLRRGYRYHERVLRPAQVIVVREGGEVSG